MTGAGQLALPEVSTAPTRDPLPRPRRISRAHRVERFVALARPARPTSEELELVREVLEHRGDLGSDVHGGLLLGDVVTQVRVRSGLSQEQVQARGGLSRRRMRAIEAGDAASAEDLVRLGRALDVSPAGLAALEPGRTTRATRVVAEAPLAASLVLPGLPGALSWDVTPWHLDAAARGFVHDHPHGAPIEEIAAAIGRSTRWVERVLESACAAVREALDDGV